MEVSLYVHYAYIRTVHAHTYMYDPTVRTVSRFMHTIVPTYVNLLFDQLFCKPLLTEQAYATCSNLCEAVQTCSNLFESALTFSNLYVCRC